VDPPRRPSGDEALPVPFDPLLASHARTTTLVRHFRRQREADRQRIEELELRIAELEAALAARGSTE
jgi:hypothetical protein